MFEIWKSSTTQNKINVVLEQIKLIEKDSWMMQSFLRLHKRVIRRSPYKRALERHKASKHQVELVLSRFFTSFRRRHCLKFKRRLLKQRYYRMDLCVSIIYFNRIAKTETADLSLCYSAKIGKLIVTAINKPLQHLSVRYLFDLDQTPLQPWFTNAKNAHDKSQCTIIERESNNLDFITGSVWYW